MSSNNNTFILPERIRKRAPLTDAERARYEEGAKYIARLMKKTKRDTAEDVPALPVGTLQCHDCPLSFPRSGGLRIHMLDFHQKRLPAGNAGRPSTGGRVAANKRAYEKLQTKTTTASVLKSEAQKKKSEQNARRYRMKKEAKSKERLAGILKRITLEYAQAQLLRRGTNSELRKMSKEYGGQYYLDIQSSMQKTFDGIGSTDSFYNRQSLIEIIVDDLVATLPEFLSDKYDKKEALGYLGACDEENSDGLALGVKDAETRTKAETYWETQEGSKNKALSMLEVLNFLHLSFAKFDFDETRIGNSIPFLRTLFKGPLA